jgi:hypothetical protein
MHKVVELRRIASAIENPETPDAKALARELIARKTDDPAWTIVPLAAIGRSDAAIDMGMTEGVDVGLFFFPGAESALRHPRFAASESVTFAQSRQRALPRTEIEIAHRTSWC